MKFVLYHDIRRGGISWEEFKNSGTLYTCNSHPLIVGVVVEWFCHVAISCQPLSRGTPERSVPRDIFSVSLVLVWPTFKTMWR